MIATLIILIFMFGDFFVAFAKHGENKNNKYNAWISMITLIINIILYYYAGLFDKFNL
jgi:hypothetical protein